jgi:two-component system response regulator DegU
MDMNMPGMNGIEATWQITRTFPRVKVIGLSVNEEAHTIEAMKAAGAIDFVSKASVAESLYEAVRGSHSHRNEMEHP